MRVVRKEGAWGKGVIGYITGHGGGRLHAAFLPGRALCAVCCVCCVLLFELRVGFQGNSCAFLVLFLRANLTSLARACKFTGAAIRVRGGLSGYRIR